MARAVLVKHRDPRRGVAAGPRLSGKANVQGSVQSIWRHPIKGFTPERLDEVVLSAGLCFPSDRLYAVEDGPSGFDPAAPQHISKQRFTVLAKIPAVARIRTRYDDETGVLEAVLEGHPPLRAPLGEAGGRAAFAAWLAEVLGDEVRGPLKVLPAPGDHRFMDDVQGYVSIINLASLRELESRIGRPVDPRRFRANLYVESWPAWVENSDAGGRLRLGEVEAEIVKPIPRCVATHVDPDTGDRDIDVVRALFDAYGHVNCGVYVSVVQGGRVKTGEQARLGR
jgi:uncharacterized protein YcbX